MPYIISYAPKADCAIAKFEAAKEALRGPFESPEAKRAAIAKYNEAENNKRESGWRLPAAPLR